MTIKLIAAKPSQAEALIIELSRSFQLDLIDFAEDEEGFHATFKAGKDETFDPAELSAFAKDLAHIKSVCEQDIDLTFLDTIHISSVGRKIVKGSASGEASISFNLTAFIRCLEIVRETIKSDDALHLFVEALQAAKVPLIDTEVVSQAAKTISNEL